jgi:hypothetical protein
MKKILDIFKKKEEEKPYMVMGDNNLPLWVIPLPSGINIGTDIEPEKKGKESKIENRKQVG